PGRPTSTKTRVIGGGPQVVSQQIARIDRVDRSPLTIAIQTRLIDYVRAAVPRCDALILSDYENGVMGADIVAAALTRAREHGLVVVVDAHGALGRFRGVTVATPNQEEAALTLSRELRTDEDVARAGRDLIKLMESQGVLITRGSEGMSVIEAGGACHHLPV